VDAAVSTAESMRCGTLLCHDIIKGAIAYSTMAGVLASVAFLGIIFLLEDRRRKPGGGNTRSDRGLDNVSVSLISAFLNLIIATFLYAALSGEDVLGPRAATLGLIAAIAISVAFLNLLYGVVWLFETWRLDLATVITRTIAALIAPAVTFAFISIRALDMLSLAESRRATKSWVGALLLALLLMLIALFVASQRRAARAHAFAGASAVRVMAYAALAVGVVTVIATGIVSELSVSYSLQRWAVAVVMVILFTAYALYGLLIGAVTHNFEPESIA
jgi:TRAP-type C4-dicarboxylate transport system permease large subunit